MYALKGKYFLTQTNLQKKSNVYNLQPIINCQNPDLSPHISARIYLKVTGKKIKLFMKTEELIALFGASPVEHGGQGVTKRCRLSWLTNSVLVHEHKCGGGGVSAYVYSCTHGAQ